MVAYCKKKTEMTNIAMSAILFLVRVISSVLIENELLELLVIK